MKFHHFTYLLPGILIVSKIQSFTLDFEYRDSYITPCSVIEWHVPFYHFTQNWTTKPSPLYLSLIISNLFAERPRWCSPFGGCPVGLLLAAVHARPDRQYASPTLDGPRATLYSLLECLYS